MAMEELQDCYPVILWPLKGAVSTLIDNCILGITANRKRCRELVESSSALATALCPSLGYKKSAEIAKKSLQTGMPVRQIVLEEGLMTKEQLDRCLDLKDMTQPGHLVEYRKLVPGKEEKAEKQ